MILKEVMSKGVYKVAPEASVQDAAELMKAANVGLLPVADDQKILGVITDRDLVLRCIAGDCPINAPVKEIMSKDPVLLEETVSLEQALEKMSDKKVGRLLVHDAKGNLTGVLSATDAAAAFNGHSYVGKLMTSLKSAHKSRSKEAVAQKI